MVELAPEMTIIIVTHNMQQAARISDHTAFFLQEVAGEPATLIEYGQTNDIFTTPMDKRTEDLSLIHISVRYGRGAVRRVRVLGGLCAPAVEDEEGVDHG